MANKKITDLQLISSVADDLSIPGDNGVQTYRCTSLQLKNYILAANNVGTTQVANGAITLAKIAAAVQELFTPTGSILAFAGTTAPAGFLLCQGQAVSRTTYASLFALIGTTHGQGDASTTFNLPDYRGRFLRGVDGGIARDPNRATRTAMATGGNTGDNVGSIQDDAMQGHHHNVTTNGGGLITQPSGGVVAGNSVTGAAAPASANYMYAKNAISDGTNGTPRTSSETRPLNASVNFIIKI